MSIRSLAATAAILSAFLPVSGWAAEPIEIDVVLPLTGSAAFLGRSEQQALQLYEKVVARSGGIHGKELRFVFHDDQTNPQTAVQLTNRIKAKSPKVIIGSTLSGLCNAMAPLLKNGPVLYCMSPSIRPQPGSFIFSSSASTVGLAEALLRYYAGRGWNKIGLITSTDATGQDARKNLTSLVGAGEYSKLSIVAEASLNPADVSAAAQVQRIKGAEPDALVVWTSGAPLGTVLKAIQDVGFTGPVATTDSNMNFDQMKQYSAFMPKELYIPAPQWLKESTRGQTAEALAAKNDFFQAFEAAGLRPDGSATFAWDPALLVVASLRALPPEATAEQLRDHLNSVKDVGGINGSYDFEKSPQRGLDKSNVVVTIWDPSLGNWRVVSELGGVPIAP